MPFRTQVAQENAALKQKLLEGQQKLAEQAVELVNLGVTPIEAPPLVTVDAVPLKKGRGRPKGSKNKLKTSTEHLLNAVAVHAESMDASGEVAQVSAVLEGPIKSRRGRPVGSKNKPKPPPEQTEESG